MTAIIEEYAACVRRISVVPDSESVPFVAKMQKAKTRKNKDYFVLRATIPKEVVQKIDVKPGEFLFFRAKKAQWYHMMDWQSMRNTWVMLPQEIRDRVMIDGLYGQAPSCESVLAATNVASLPRMIDVQSTQIGETQWK
jgi:hypothetical protein